MPNHLPSWLPDDLERPRLLAVAGWDGRLFALVEHASGAALCFHDGEVLRADTAADLLADCSDDVRAVLGLDAESLELAALLDQAADRAAVGDTDPAWTLVTDLVDRFGGPVTPEMIPRPVDRDAWLVAALRRASDYFRAGDAEAARIQLQELAAASDPEPRAMFFWWTDPDQVSAASDAAKALPPAEGADLPAPGAGWQALHLAEPTRHPAGVDVQVVPVIPGDPVADDSPRRAAYKLLANGSHRLKRMLELSVPAMIVDREREMQVRFLARVVALASGRGPTPEYKIDLAGHRPLRLSAPPEEPGATWLFRVPYHYPGRYVVQRPDRLVVVEPAGVLHQLPPCSWRPIFGSKRYVVFAGPVRSGAAPAGVAVLDVDEGTWLERWPDHRGVECLHRAWLPEDDGCGASWLVDPRVPASRPVPGRVVAHETEYGRGQLVFTEDGLVRTAPAPVGLDLAALPLGDESPAWRVDVRTGDVFEAPWDPWDEEAEPRPPQLDLPWSPAEAELAGLSRAAFGAVLVLWRGAVYVNGIRVALLDGPVEAVAIQGGNRSLNGHLAVLTPDGILGFTLEAHGEDEPGSMSLDHRVPEP